MAIGTELIELGRRQFANELHALLYPEDHPMGDPVHDPEHPYWLKGGTGAPGDYFEWSAETIEWVAERINQELGK